ANVLNELRSRLTCRQARPLHPLEGFRDVRSSLRRRIYTHRHDERTVARHHMCPLIRQIPLQAEITLPPRSRARRNDGYEQVALVDLAPDFLIPGVSAAKLAAIEPNFDAGRVQSVENPPCNLHILRGIAEEYRARRLGQGRPLGGSLFTAPEWPAPLMPPIRTEERSEVKSRYARRSPLGPYADDEPPRSQQALTHSPGIRMNG